MDLVRRIKNHPLYLIPNFRNFFIGDVLVAVAERFFAITFVWWVVSQEGENGKWLGVLMSVEALPIFFLSPFVGPFIDKYDKKKCMLMGVLMQAFFVSTIAALFHAGMLTFPLLCLLSFLMSCFVPQFEDSVSASIPQIVDEKHLSSATATQASSIDFSNIIAASGSATCVAAFGIFHTILINIALYIIGAIFLLRIKADLSPVKNGDEDGEQEEGYFDDLKGGLKYILSNRQLTYYSVLYSIGTIFIVSIFVLIPLLVKDVLREDIKWVAVFETAVSVGVVITALLLSFKERYRKFYHAMSANYFIFAFAMAVLAFSTGKAAISVMIFAIGCVFATDMALSFVFFQHVVKNEYKGRFFGLMSSITAGMTPLSYMFAGFMTDYVSIKWVALINSAGGLLLGAAMLMIPRVEGEIGVSDEECEEPGEDCECGGDGQYQDEDPGRESSRRERAAAEEDRLEE